MGEDTFREAFTYALSLLSKRDYSLKVLAEKVKRRFPDITDNELESLKEELVKSGYVNELEAARRYFLGKAEKGWGKHKIFYHLKKLGFPEEVIREVVLTTPYDYSFIEKEIKKLSTRKGREQLRRFLLQRGFSLSEIGEILRKRVK